MKKIIFISSIFFLFLFIFFAKIESFRPFLSNLLPSVYKQKIKKIVLGENTVKEIDRMKYYKNLNYNQKFLPITEFVELKISKINLQSLDLKGPQFHYLKSKINLNVKFFLENKNNLIFLLDTGKNFFFTKFDDSNKKKINWQKISNNLNEFVIKDLLDIKIINDNFFIFFVDSINKNCNNYHIAFSKLDTNKLSFKKFKIFSECITSPVGGRIENYILDNKDGILFTTGAVTEDQALAQDDNSIKGKIIFIDFENKDYQIYSKGHRNPQGLFVEKDLVLATEHGPRGGDEINLIKKNKNYGWSQVSLGEKYIINKKFDGDYFYKKEHKKFGFEEPIYSFVPSIGISQIIKIPNSFSKLWKNNFIVSSVGSKAVSRIKFKDKDRQVQFIEKIFVGERIRDLIVLEDKKTILLALENSYGEMMSIKAK